MKALKTIAVLIIAASAANVFAQGSLAPPGSPAATMKTLEQVEPRIPISSVPYTITSSGSYYLTTNLTLAAAAKNGITVDANDVTIDMAGHTLMGSGASSGNGIYQVSSYRNLAVLNGKLAGWSGAGKYGIFANGYASRIHGIQAASNHVGVWTGKGSSISDCATHNNAENGIQTDFGCTISDCAAYNNGENGIEAGDGNTVSGCAACDNIGVGISTVSGSTISDCTASWNDDDGVLVEEGCLIAGNNCHRNGNVGDGAGIHVTGNNNRIENNNVTDNDRGIDVDAPDNFIARNTAAGNTTNWDVAASNVCYVVNANKTAVSFSGDSGGAAPGNDNPWANFTY